MLNCYSYQIFRQAEGSCPHDLAPFTAVHKVDGPVAPLGADMLTFGQLWI